MRAFDIIKKKRDGECLTPEEIEFFIQGFVQGKIPDYQMAAFLMAVYFRNMTAEETTALTLSMTHSGETLDLASIPGVKVDKHSTGGVGDTTTIILAPLVAAAGLPVAKISGRGLGHTGGTLDKLEAIPGLSTSVAQDAFIRQVQDIGIAVVGQTADLVPADKKMYALRDVTATIDSIPLISGSIMSKKIAAAADAILLDVKVGSGAFMKTLDDARALARSMVDIGKLAGRKVAAVITDMDQPLGNYIGNALEVLEAIEILQGKHQGSPLYEVSLFLAAHLLAMGGAVPGFEPGKALAQSMLTSGAGARKFAQMIAAQGGNGGVVENPALLPAAKFLHPVKAPVSGYIAHTQAEQIGMAAMILGAGRKTKEDVIDPAVGIIIKKRRGDPVYEGELLAEIHANDMELALQAEKLYLEALHFTPGMPEPAPLILDFIA